MSKQDRNGVRAPQDLERKYDLASLVGVKKAVERNDSNLTKVNAELENFMSSTLGSIENMQSQIDGNITTYYRSGVPTLSNLPTSDWETTKYNVHLGDLYYDKDTGYAYRFYLDSETNTYGWLRITDTDVVKALAIANAANDTADSKRRIFLAPPLPPYDNGDLWLNDGEIFVCQISKGIEEVYAEDDFIIATKYTDDTLASQVGDELKVVQGTVTTIKEGVDEFKIQFDTTIKTIQNETKETTEALETMSYSFGTKDLQIANSNDPVNTRINNQGLKVYTYKELETIVNHNGLGTNKLIVVGDAQIANLRIVKATDENGKPCTDFHHLISTIQDVTDLE